jgi:C4-dicarboxylate transporter, DctM subunit
LSTSLIITLVFAVLLLSGAPLFLAITASAALSLALIESGGGLSELIQLMWSGTEKIQESDALLGVMARLVNIPQEMFDKTTAMPIMIAIPLFTLAGTIITEGQISKRLIDIIKSLFGFLPAGLAIAALVGCAFLAALSGSSAVTIMAIGGILWPAMKREGYSDNFSLGLITTAGAVGILAPPSLPLIIYGAVSQTDVNQLFIAGVVPMMVCIGCMAMYGLYFVSTNPVTREKFSGREVLATLRSGIWALLFPILLLFAIYGGYATPTEASALAVMYAIIVEVFIHRAIRLRDLPRLTVETMVLVGGILMILLMALAFTYYLTDQQVPQQMTAFMKQYVTTKTGFLISVNVMLLIVGCLMDIFSAILIFAPLIVPVAIAYDVDLVHLGIIMIINLEIGFLTPPLGISLFVASNFFKKPSMQIIKSALPFVGMLFVALMLITFLPELSLWLVHFSQR